MSGAEIDEEILERRMREKLLAPTKATPGTAREAKMIARVLGSKTAADHFLRHEKPALSDSVRRKPYRPPEIRLKFQYWERRAENLAAGCWIIERFENGTRVKSHEGTDFSKRDDLLIRLKAAGAAVEAVTVAEVEPRPIVGRARDAAKPLSKRMAILDQIATIDSDDVADFSLEDYEFEQEPDRS